MIECPDYNGPSESDIINWNEADAYLNEFNYIEEYEDDEEEENDDHTSP